ncbi:hypothetical protein PoB_002452900 [Plakobranchus ocellatus]|uniref:Pentapeptide repeat-containing protein n=1 Tax=Plakobranchus ocellatus TaxID=259542 RepID=A0AAV3ZRR9_9GAST|nr:hypothetical protein PoB_002452900 [Plakobranchus ocellatus]
MPHIFWPNNNTATIDSSKLNIHTDLTDSNFVSIHSGVVGRKSLNTKFSRIDFNHSDAIGHKSLNTEFRTIDSNHFRAIDRKSLNTKLGTIDFNHSDAIGHKSLNTEFRTIDSNHFRAIDRKSLNTKLGTIDFNHSDACSSFCFLCLVFCKAAPNYFIRIPQTISFFLLFAVSSFVIV